MKLPEWWPSQDPYIIGDCIQELKKLPKQSVDLVLTDPPYGVNEEYWTYQDTKTHLKNLVPQFMPEILRVAKVALITCGYDNMWLYPPPTHILIWTFYPGQALSKWGYNSWQPILAYGKDPLIELTKDGIKLGEGGRQDLIDCPTRPGETGKFPGHPCPKPLSLWTKLVRRGTVRKGAIVLDPFLGSGTTLEACRRTGMLGLGYEIDEHYRELIKKRSMGTVMELDVYGEI